VGLIMTHTTDRRPNFQIIADGVDVTAVIRSRFVRLNWRDERGISADTLEIVIDDRPDLDGLYIAMPRKGVNLELLLGYGDAMHSVGRFTVDEANPNGPPEQLTIKAKAADMRDSLKVKKSRGFDDISIASLVATVATDHGLAARVADALSAEIIKRIDQTDESDLHMLTRLARERGAIAKTAYGFLLFVPKGEAKSVSGKLLGKVSIHRSDLVRWDATLADREKYTAVEARYHDKSTAKEHTVTTGSGKPVDRIKRLFPDAVTAQKAADARLKKLQAGTGTMHIDLAGSHSLVSEVEATLSGLRPGLNGAWTIDAASHSLDKSQGWIASLDLERK